MIFSFLVSCHSPGNSENPGEGNLQRADALPLPASIGAIPLPPAYRRTAVAEGSFGEWLRELPLKKDKTVYLYNGQKKPDQSAQC